MTDVLEQEHLRLRRGLHRSRLLQGEGDIPATHLPQDAAPGLEADHGPEFRRVHALQYLYTWVALFCV